MVRPSLLLSFAIIIGAFTLGSSAQAAAPVHVDVQEIIIEYKPSWSQTTYKVIAVDDAGNQVVFTGLGAYVLYFTDAGPFPLYGTFSTNRLDEIGLSFKVANSGGGTFSVSSSHSDPVNLWATNTPRKPLKFSRTGAAGFHGAFTYYRESGYQAYDDDVTMEGNYQIDFGNAPWVDGHRFVCYRVYFDLKKPEN
jgi:hypothetical protein